MARSRYFNPRPREEGDYTAETAVHFKTYFNPRPREEGDDVPLASTLKFVISIHALVKRATLWSCTM